MNSSLLITPLDSSVSSLLSKPIIITTVHRANIKYAVLGLGVMAGFVLHIFPMYAKENIGSMFVSVCFNFTPFLSQVVTFLLGAQAFPGTFTTYGGACLFIGCTLLAMDYKDQKDLVSVPLIGKFETEDTTDSA